MSKINKSLAMRIAQMWQNVNGDEPPNGLALSRRKRVVSLSKIRAISCAQRSATAPCWVARDVDTECIPKNLFGHEGCEASI
jgi:hypothetical protein